MVTVVAAKAPCGTVEAEGFWIRFVVEVVEDNSNGTPKRLLTAELEASPDHATATLPPLTISLTVPGVRSSIFNPYHDDHPSSMFGGGAANPYDEIVGEWTEAG